jgi:hypothetical protein
MARGQVNVGVLGELEQALVTDGRIADVEPWSSTHTYRSGRSVPQMILRLVVDDAYQPTMAKRPRAVGIAGNPAAPRAAVR